MIVLFRTVIKQDIRSMRKRLTLTRVRRFKLDKFLDEIDGTERDIKALFVNYHTNIPVDFKRKRNK